MSARLPAPIGDRPLGAIDLLDGSFSALRQRPRTMVTIMAALVVPSALLEGWLSRNALAGGTLTGLLTDPALADEVGTRSPFGSESMVSYVMNWLLVAVAGVPIARVVGGWLTGSDVGPGDALRFTARRWWVILVAFVCVHVVEGIASLILVLPGVVAMVLFSLTSPVIALEDLGPIASMRRSVRLVRRGFGQVFGLVVLTAIVSFGVTTAVSTVPTIGAALLGPSRAWPLISMASAMTSIILVPFTTAAMALLYLDLRFRTEGLDLQIRALDLLPDEPLHA